MNNILRYRSEHSVQKISDRMKVNHLVTDDSFSVKDCPILIRYGNSGPTPNKSPVVYNSAQAICNAAVKTDAREIMRDHGIKIPRTVLPTDKAHVAVSGSWIARPPEHSGGDNFVEVIGRPDFTKYLEMGWYLSKVFDKTHEFRVHVAHGRVLFCQDKRIVPHQLNSNTDGNNTGNWSAIYWDDYHYGICVESIKAVECLGLDWGAVDVVYNSRTGLFVVLEVNTAPSLPGQLAPSKYAMYFDWLLRSKTKRKHFDYRKIKQASKLAWRDLELL